MDLTHKSRTDLEAENCRLKDRIQELEGLLSEPDEFVPIKMSQTHKRLLGLFRKRRLVTKDFAFSALYGSRPECDQPEIKIVDVMVCKLRKRLEPYGITIETQWGIGYYISEESRPKLDALFNGAP